MDELKPCPFCGAAVHMEEEYADALSLYYRFICDACGMYCTQNYNVTRTEAIESWNRRATDDR